MHSNHSCIRSLPSASHATPAALSALLLALALVAGAQAPSVQPPPNPPEQGSKHKSHASHAETLDAKPLSEGDLRNRLQGKAFYLRGGYIDNNLRFDVHGRLNGNSPQVSYTLSLIQINKVHVSKHQLQMEGIRYGVHYVSEGTMEDPAESSEKVRITPKKKVVRISIGIAEPAKTKKSRKGEPQTGSGSDQGLITTQAAANRILEGALDRVFAAGLDDRMIASLPDYWRFYFQGVEAKTGYKPSDPAVLRQPMVDQKARLLTNFEPPSNDFAQNAGVVGVAQYHVVVGPDGRPEEIAVGRPIGFGLDENAVASIRKASFQPAMKDGKTVPVLLDLLVQFRIYSKRTGAGSGSEAASATLSEPQAPPLPGPYSASQPTTKQP